MIDSIDTDDETVLIRAHAQGLQAACPGCGVLSGRVHSRYVRRLADSPVGGRPVVIEVRVRRFRCGESGCSRATFAEQIDGLTFRYGRRSSGLQTVLRHVALMLAGRAGARLAKTLTAAVSHSTLLRLARALPDPEPGTPRVLGVDEFALRKGHVYGTILVDIETRRPVDLLPGRSVATVAQWLTDHPGVEVICRDRSVLYAEAGRLGAPDAIHVADRWHIWKNLAEAVEKTVIQHRALLRKPQEEIPARPVTPADFAEPTAAEPVGPRRTGRLSDRVRRQHAAVHDLLARGEGLRAIAPGAGPGPQHRPSPRPRRRSRRAAGRSVDRPHQYPRPAQDLPPPAMERRLHERRPALRRTPRPRLHRRQHHRPQIHPPPPRGPPARRDTPPQAALRTGRHQLDHPPPRQPRRRPGPAAQGHPRPLPRTRPGPPDTCGPSPS
ncbi:ISL3 family transposase [Streptomyces netropsis]|uniref:ISL3 family transposase n=1 Tax=Streptomyces netropsis TaxID=55404 RepID=UPI0037BA28D5